MRKNMCDNNKHGDSEEQQWSFAFFQGNIDTLNKKYAEDHENLLVINDKY